MLIVIIGPDGCGKTTVANRLLELASVLGFTNAHHFASNFGVLPTIGAIKKVVFSAIGRTYYNRSAHPEGEPLGGMKNAPNSPFKGVLLLLWYTVDFFLGHQKCRRWNKNNELVIFARYYHDYFFQRAYSRIPQVLVRACFRLIPRPDLVLFLSRTPAEIFKLKPELSIDEINRQNNAIITEFGLHSNFVMVNADGGVEQTVEIITTYIRERC